VDESVARHLVAAPQNLDAIELSVIYDAHLNLPESNVIVIRANTNSPTEIALSDAYSGIRLSRRNSRKPHVGYLISSSSGVIR